MSDQFRLYKGDHNHHSQIAEKSQFWTTVWGDRKPRNVDRKTEANFGQSILTAKKNYLNRINHGNMPEKGQFKTKVAYTNHARDGANAYMDRIGKRKGSCQIFQLKPFGKSGNIIVEGIITEYMDMYTNIF